MQSHKTNLSNFKSFLEVYRSNLTNLIGLSGSSLSEEKSPSPTLSSSKNSSLPEKKSPSPTPSSNKTVNPKRKTTNAAEETKAVKPNVVNEKTKRKVSRVVSIKDVAAENNAVFEEQKRLEKEVAELTADILKQFSITQALFATIADAHAAEQKLGNEKLDSLIESYPLTMNVELYDQTNQTLKKFLTAFKIIKENFSEEKSQELVKLDSIKKMLAPLIQIMTNMQRETNALVTSKNAILKKMLKLSHEEEKLFDQLNEQVFNDLNSINFIAKFFNDSEEQSKDPKNYRSKQQDLQEKYQGILKALHDWYTNRSATDLNVELFKTNYFTQEVQDALKASEEKLLEDKQELIEAALDENDNELVSTILKNINNDPENILDNQAGQLDKLILNKVVNELSESKTNVVTPVEVNHVSPANTSPTATNNTTTISPLSSLSDNSADQRSESPTVTFTNAPPNIIPSPKIIQTPRATSPGKSSEEIDAKKAAKAQRIQARKGILKRDFADPKVDGFMKRADASEDNAENSSFEFKQTTNDDSSTATNVKSSNDLPGRKEMQNILISFLELADKVSFWKEQVTFGGEELELVSSENSTTTVRVPKIVRDLQNVSAEIFNEMKVGPKDATDYIEVLNHCNNHIRNLDEASVKDKLKKLLAFAVTAQGREQSLSRRFFNSLPFVQVRKTATQNLITQLLLIQNYFTKDEVPKTVDSSSFPSFIDLEAKMKNHNTVERPNRAAQAAALVSNTISAIKP